MSLSPICPNCHLPEVVHEAWTSLCLNCLHRQHHGDPTVVPDVDPGVDRPVRPGHNLTSNAGADTVEDTTETPADPEPVLPEEAAKHEDVPGEDAVSVEARGDVPPAPPSEPPSDGA